MVKLSESEKQKCYKLSYFQNITSSGVFIIIENEDNVTKIQKHK